jgi:hypothetical protein
MLAGSCSRLALRQQTAGEVRRAACIYTPQLVKMLDCQQLHIRAPLHAPFLKMGRQPNRGCAIACLEVETATMKHY